MPRLPIRLLAFVSAWMVSIAAPAATIDDVRERGNLRCGVADDLPGFSALREDGRRIGFDTDLCRAVAAAVLGSAHDVRFVLLAPQERITALREGRVDLVASGLARSLAAELEPGVDFAPVVFYDGQAVITRRETGARSVRDLSGGSVCVSDASPAYQQLGDHIRSQRLRIGRTRFDSVAEAWQAYTDRRCDAFSSEASVIAALRTQIDAPADHLILPEILSKEPIAPLVRDDDPHWRKTVSWVVFGLIEAEERGLTADNVARVRDDTADRQTLRLVGEHDDIGAPLGLDPQWLMRAVVAVGNYGEIFERNAGTDSALRLRRGLNELWTRGGLMYAPPLR